MKEKPTDQEIAGTAPSPTAETEAIERYPLKLPPEVVDGFWRRLDKAWVPLKIKP